MENDQQNFTWKVIFLLIIVLRKLIKVAINEFEINTLYSVSLPEFTYQCGLNYTNINLQTLQDKDLIPFLENVIRGYKSKVMGGRYVKSHQIKKIEFMDANSFYGHSMSQPLPYDWIKLDKNNKMEVNLNTPDDSDIGYFLENDLLHPDKTKEPKLFSLCPKNKVSTRNKFSEYVNEKGTNT